MGSRFAIDRSDSESTNSAAEDSLPPSSRVEPPARRSSSSSTRAAAKTATWTAQTQKQQKKKKNPNYCFCDKPETMEMIGCDYCDMWYHPECLGLDDEQTLKLTESTTWMCPECMESTEASKPGRRNGTYTASQP